MIESLFQAYTPLLIWPGLGLILSRFIPNRLPKLLGLVLYWVGVPLQILALGRQTEFSHRGELIPVVAVGVVFLSIGLAIASWWGLKWFIGSKSTDPTQNSLNRASFGSFILAAMLGNTGFIGLALTGVLIAPEHNSWAILYSVTNNVIATYGIAVFIASYFARSESQKPWWVPLRDVITVPSLWAFFIGFSTRHLELPSVVESALEEAVWLVIASALVLVGIRLGSVKGWRSFQLASIPTLLRVVIVPLLVGLGATYLGVTGDPRLILVLMAGTPTGLAVLILAEVYDLDRDLLASCIAMTFGGLLLMLPLWLALFD